LKIKAKEFMNKNVFNIPNLLTSLNLASGSCALIAVIISEQYVGYFIAFSLLMDFLDGLVARALKIQSNIGKDLDSLADVVSFGLVPSFMYIVILYNTVSDAQTNPLFFLKLIPALLIVVFSALRLAKFNNEARDSKYFYGLNTPTNAIFTFGIFAFMSHLSIEPQALQAYYYGFVGLIIVQSLLLVSDFKMFSNKSISKELKYIVSFAFIIGAAVGSYFLVGILALSVGVFAYVFCSILVLNWMENK
jgi:CDP-diacylglycerol--serine O-phosphatidyltransferase